MKRMSGKERVLAGILGVSSAALMGFFGGILDPKPEVASAAEPMARMRPEMPRMDDVSPHLVIETTKHTLTLNMPGKSPIVMTAQGAYALKRGVYTIAARVSEPKWVAPPTYFLRRGLPVPEQGSHERVMRGALGHQALMLDSAAQLAIHSGPVWNSEVGGIKLSESDMRLVFDAIKEGTRVEVL
jgi:hypothetical protein